MNLILFWFFFRLLTVFGLLRVRYLGHLWIARPFRCLYRWQPFRIFCFVWCVRAFIYALHITCGESELHVCIHLIHCHIFKFINKFMGFVTDNRATEYIFKQNFLLCLFCWFCSIFERSKGLSLSLPTILLYSSTMYCREHTKQYTNLYCIVGLFMYIFWVHLVFQAGSAYINLYSCMKIYKYKIYNTSPHYPFIFNMLLFVRTNFSSCI
jgi:hypothetical protein